MQLFSNYFKFRGILFSLPIFLSSFYSCSTDETSDQPGIEEPIGPKTGIFVDSPVSGLRYETETYSGFTDENGKYNYEEGETVTFYIGDIKLGSAKASEELTPLSITSTSDATLETLEVQNIAALLQTLDLDGDATNGITIDEEVVNVLSISEINFNESIISILGKIALEVFEKTGIELQVIYPQEAAIHLAETLNLEYEPRPSMALNFLPTFTNVYSPDNKAVNWIHYFDGEGKLIKSEKFEKYPSRILSEYTFSNYSEENSEVSIGIKNYNYSIRPAKNFSYETNLQLDENYFFKGIFRFSEEYQALFKTVFLEFTQEGWPTITRSFTIPVEGEEKSYKTERDFDEIGFATEIRSYNYYDTHYATELRTATSFGEIKKAGEADGSGYIEYFYREDNTLERHEVVYEDENNGFHHYYEYEEDESISKISRIDNDNSWKEFRYCIGGYTTREEIYRYEVLHEIRYYEIIDNQSYKTKTEHYDDNGELEYTVYFDQSGNVTDTIYE